MRKFIFITSEGDTISPNKLDEINNLQVLGIVNNVFREDEAMDKLISENEWILQVGFLKENIQCLELK